MRRRRPAQRPTGYHDRGHRSRPAAPCASRTGRSIWPTGSSPPSRPPRASPWTTRKTSTTTNSGSPRSRNRCRASRTSAPTWRCPPRSWPPACTSLGWLNDISDAGWSNKKNLRPDLLEASVDPDRKFSAPYMSGLVGPGLQQGRHRPGHHDHRRHVGSGVQGQGQPVLRLPGRPRHDHAVAGQLRRRNPTTESIQKAVDVVREQKDKGQIRRFTGNDYADDLAAGNVAIAQAYSGDVVQLQADNPDLQFVAPESGGNNLRRHHGDSVHHPEPEGGGGLDQLCLRPPQLRQTRRVRPVRAGAVGHDRRAQQDRSRSCEQSADQSAAGDLGQGRRAGRRSPTSRPRSGTPPTPRSPAHSRWPG